MLKKIFRVLVVATCLLSGPVLCPVSAQSRHMDQYCMSDPQTWGMVKYGGQTPDLYTGTVRAEIPFYTYKDQDFEIPVSLTYASNGYMPNSQANFVGLGWSLAAGGCITRRVQGEKDECGDFKAITGYYDYVAGGQNADVGYDAKLCAIGNTICYKSESTTARYDTEPDVFMFSFLGYSGKFVIQPSGVAAVFDTNVPSGELTIDLSGLSTSWPETCIKIRTGNGYEYTFGALERYEDFTLPTTSYAVHMMKNNNYDLYESDDSDNYDTWYLKKISAPNGRSTSFSYIIDESSWMQTYEPGASYSSVLAGNVGVPVDDSIITRLDGGWSISSSYSTSWVLERTRNQVLLSSIDVDGNFEIVFSYIAREKEKGYVFDMLKELNTPFRLSSIKAVDKVSETEIRSAYLDYKYPSSDGNQVMMLSKVSISGLGDYLMEYYNENDVFPYLGSCAIDHWGYYNSSTSTNPQTMVPFVRLDDNYIETVIGSSRNPDPEKSVTGMLKVLKYPTGGQTRYSYEPHEYGKIVTRNSLTRGRFSLEDTPSGTIAGGLRLKEVTDSASSNAVSRRIYEYVTEDGRSSGIMMDFPRYCMCTIKDTIVAEQHIYEYNNTCTSSCPGYLLDGNYIGYSSVREIYGDGSSKVTKFTSWEEFPDVLDDNDPITSDADTDLIHIEYTFPDHLYNIIRVPTSASSLRGKVLSVSHYDRDGNLLKTGVMEYGVAWNSLKYLKSVKAAADSIYIHHTLCESPRLIGKSFVYPDGTVKEETYSYNAQNQIRSSSIINCDDSRHITYYFHPQDLPIASRTDVEQEMVDSNYISEPVYVVNTRRKGASEKIVSAIRTAFANIEAGDTRMFVKSSESLAEITSDLPDITSASSVLTQAGSLVYRTMFTWNDYNRYGRPCHLTDVNGVPSLLLWGYGGLYPTVMLKNVLPDQISVLVHAADAHKNVLGWGGLDASTETLLRGINGSSVIVWNWKPFVGLSKKTGPDGNATTYSYDDFGRLESVTGPDGNTVSEYRYNIK